MRYRRFLIAIVVTVVLGHSTGPGAAGSARDIERLEAETIRYPDSIAAWVRLCEARVELGRAREDFHQYELAGSAIVNAWDLDTTDVATLLQLGVVQAKYKRFKKTLRYLDKAIVENLYNAEAWGMLGDAFMALGRYRAADSCFYIVWQLDQGFDTHVRLARRHIDMGTHEEALELVTKAVRIAEDSLFPPERLAEAYREFAHVQLSGGRLDEAERLITRALELDPDNVPTLGMKAGVLAMKGEIDPAIDIYERLSERSPNPRYRAALAKLLVLSGRGQESAPLVEGARTDYEALAARYPSAFSSELAAFYLETESNLDEAVRLAWRESRRRRDIHTYDLLAWAYYKNKKYGLAWSSISLALRTGTKHPRVTYRAAVIAKAAGKKDKYAFYAEETRRLNPSFEAMFGPL